MSVGDPHRDCAVNVGGTLNVVQAASRHGVSGGFRVHRGGRCVATARPFRPTRARLPAPEAPYGASKWAGEAYIVTWREASGIRTPSVALATSMALDRVRTGRPVSSPSSAITSGRAPPRSFSARRRPTRDYVHVSDVVAAMRAASGAGGIYNVATGIECDVRTVFESLRATAGVDLKPELAPLRSGELERSCLDPSRAARELGWRACVDLDSGLAATYRALVAEFADERSARPT